MDKPKVIYIMGCGRSGTTILDILLGNHANFLSVGELNNAPNSWNKDEACSCGLPLKDCDIWGNVGGICFNKDSDDVHYGILRHQKDIEKQVNIIKHMFGYYDQSTIDAYHSYVHDTFKLLEKESSAKVIIDSSKSIGRGLALLKNKMIDVQVIHLVRDPRGVYSSFQKKNLVTPTKNILSLAFYWNSVNLLASILKLIVGDNKFLRIRYEDLVTDCDNVIGQIEDFIDEDLSDVKQKISDKTPMDRGHLASGNRVRSQKVALNLQPDFEWMNNIKLHQRIMVSMVCFPLMVAYNYFDKNSVNRVKPEN